MLVTGQTKPVSGEELQTLLETVVSRWQPQAKLRSIEPITPDASLRRYFRLHLEGGAAAATIVAMIFDSLASPEHSGSAAVTTDAACVELSEFFGAHAISVPRLLCDARDAAVLLIEDCGDRLLIDTVLGAQPAGPELTGGYYRAAIDQLIAIQQIPAVPGFFPFERAFTEEQYFREMLELRDFILQPLGAEGEELAEVESAFRRLAGELNALPKVLVHRDFHSWNLLLDPSQRVRVIDYQDALMATRCYDIVALLNDRDTDSALGAELYQSLLGYFAAQLGGPEWFAREYPRVLLQRDLKVAGRFAKLSTTRGLRQYERWIPGTLRRIGRVLAVLKEQDSIYEALSMRLEAKLPAVAAGALQPLQLGS